MKQMKALILQDTSGKPDALALKDFPYPLPHAGEAVIKIQAAALNHRDAWIVQGMYANIQTPVILGSDGSGVVQEVGEGVHSEWLNKAVVINPSLDWGENPRTQQKNYRILGMPDNGTQAEYIAVPVQNLVEKPSYLSFAEAAAIPLGGLTGYRALFTQGQLSSEDIVLITGIGGGVATLMLNMAVAIGAAVVVTSGDDNKIERAIQAGAKGGANYNDPEWSQKISKLTGDQGINLIVDSGGGTGFDNLINLLNPGGRLVFFGATTGNPSGLNLRKIFWKQITIQGTTMGTHQEFAQMLHLFESCEIHPFIDGPYPFSQYQEAYQRMLTGTQFGKIILTPEQSP